MSELVKFASFGLARFGQPVHLLRQIDAGIVESFFEAPREIGRLALFLSAGFAV
jgi:hypothetical protein